MKRTTLKTYGQIKNSQNFIIDVLENKSVYRLYELDRVEQKQFFMDRATHWNRGNTVYKDILIELYTGALVATALTYHKALDRVLAYTGPGFEVYVEQLIPGQIRIYTTKKYYYSRTIDLKGYGYDIETYILEACMDILKMDNKEIYTENYYKNLD